MATIIKRYTKGIALKGESSDITENVEGSLFLNSTDIRLKTYIEGTVRQIVTNSQAQALTNKTIVAANNNIITAASGNLTSTNLNDALAELQASIDAAVSTGYSASDITDNTNPYNLLVNYSTATAFYATIPDYEGTAKVEFSNLVSGKSITLSIINSEGSGGDYPVLVSFKPPVYNSLGIENLPSYYSNMSSSLGLGGATSEIDLISSQFSGGFQTAIIATPTGLGKLNPDGTRDELFHLGAGQYLTGQNVTAVDTGVYLNELLVAGDFTNYAGTSGRNRLIRLDPYSGAVSATFCANASDGNKFNAIIHSVQADYQGEVIVAGSFTDYAGTTNRNRLIRLNADGTLDTTFCVNASDGNKFNGTVFCTEVQEGGGQPANSSYFVGGSFTNYAGTTNRNRLVKLNTFGNVDATFCVNAVDGNKFNNTVEVIRRQSDGKILVGGSFTDYAGTSGRSRLIRLNANGTLDTTFCVNASDGNKFNNTVLSIQIHGDKILVGGSFTSYSGLTNFNGLVRLNADGTRDTSFSQSPRGTVTAISPFLTPNQTFLIGSNTYGRQSLSLLDGAISDLSYETIQWRENLNMSFLALPQELGDGTYNPTNITRLILLSKSKYFKY